MPYTHARTRESRGGVRLSGVGGCISAAVVVVVLLSNGVTVHGQNLTFQNPRDLLVGDLAALVELLEASRPAPVSREDVGTILRALPAEGEVTELGFLAQQKVAAVRQLLDVTRRDWYEIKVIELPHAAIGLHARTVVLISAPAVALVSAAELQALAAHEIGHEYVWTEYERARHHGDRKRVKELELVCDAIAMVILHQLDMDPSTVPDAIEKVERFNRQRSGRPANENDYPTLAERRAFAGEIERWLRNSTGRTRRGHRRN